MGLGSDTVTLLFTDVEGSVRLWEADWEAMAEASARHNGLVREQIEAGGGRVFTAIGEAFRAVFADPAAALASAVELQRAVGAERWPSGSPIRVRVALHAGTCVERDGGYVGPVVNRAVTSERCEFTGWCTQLRVRQRPLVSVTSITSVLGTAVDITGGLDINPAARTIRKKDGSPFTTDSPVVLVTYVAGWGTAVPAAVNTAARYILRNLWDSQRGAAAAPVLGGGELVPVPGFGFAIPNRAAQLLDGSLGGVPFRQEAYI